ncbi:MAG: alpha-2-macroglobulin family protein, partial [Candidatus Eremiobacterota bacterium]
MLRPILLVLALLMLAGPALGAGPDPAWKAAAQAFRERSYRPALDAYRAFERAARPQDPRRQEARYRIAMCLIHLKETERARRVLDDWLPSAPDTLWKARGLIARGDLGQFPVQDQDYTRAIALFERLGGPPEELIQAYRKRAGCRNGRAAEEDLAAAIRLDPSGRLSGQAYLELAEHYRYQGDGKRRALEVYDEMLWLQPRGPSAASAVLESARLLAEEERFEEALERCERLRRDHPGSREEERGRELSSEIRASRLELSTGRTFALPGTRGQPEPSATLRVRNHAAVQLSVYRLDLIRQVREQRSLEALPSGPPLSTRSIPTAPGTRYGWFEASVPLPVTASGAYLVVARAGAQEEVELVLVSRLALVGAAGQDGPSTVWAVDASRGSPVTQLEAWQAPVLKDGRLGDSRRLYQGFGGLLSVERGEQPTLVAVRAGEEVALTTFPKAAAGAQRIAYVFSDRPVYRPGQQLHYQAILRRSLQGDLYVPIDREVSVRLEDPTGKLVLDRRQIPSPLGTLHGDVELAPEAALGDYQLLVEDGEETLGSAVVRVDEYRPPEFEVSVQPAAARIEVGGTAEVTLSARYYSGEPLAGARARWEVGYVEENPAPPRIPALSWFFPASSSRVTPTAVSRGDLDLDARGRSVVRFPVRIKDARPDRVYRYLFTASVTDSGRRTVDGHGSLLASNRTTFLELWTHRAFASPGETLDLEATAATATGAPTGLAGTVTLARWGRGRDGKPGWQPQPGQQTLDIGPDGRGRLPWRAELPGSYQARLEGRDAEGRPVRASATFQVGQETEGKLFDYGAVQVVPDRDLYRTGDLARIMINTREPGMDVLLLFEAEGNLRRMVVHCPEQSTLVPVPIGPDLSPEFRLSAVAVRDYTMLDHERHLMAARAEQVLTVRVTPDAVVKPGQRGRLAVETTDSQGRPVQAEVSLAVADASVFSVLPEAVPDVATFFYGQRYGGTFEGFDRGAGFSMPQVRGPARAREYSPDTALWRADLTTGRDGKAVVELTYPDSLTTWQVIARAVTRDTKVGQGSSEVLVKKDLLVRLAAPRFLTERDRATLGALVHNSLSTAQEVRLELESSEVAELVGAAQARMEVPRGAQKRHDFKLEVTRAGELTLRVAAIAPAESDALKLTLPILPHGSPRFETQAGQVTGRQKLRFRLARRSASSRLEVRLSSTLAGAVASSLDYLVDYPYGCVEQTVSRFVPAVAVGKTLQGLSLEHPGLQKRLPRVLESGLTRLASLQHGDGGWGWWRYDPSDPAMTAWAVHGLLQARQAGCDVPEPMLARAQAFLSKRVRRWSGDDLARAVFALSCSQDAPDEALDRLMAQRDELALTERF